MNEIIGFSTNVRNFFNVEKTPKTFQNLTQIWRNGMLTEKSNFQWKIKIILDFPCRVLRLVKIMASPSYLTLSLSTTATTMREVRVSKWVWNYPWYDDASFVWSCWQLDTLCIVDWIIQTFTFKIFIFIIYFFKERSNTASLLHLSKENEYFHFV